MKSSLSAGVIPVATHHHEWQFLLLRAFGNWDFPKGMVEAGEDPLESALRELEEETSISKVKILAKEAFIETAPYGRGKVARYYLGEVSFSAQVRFDPNPMTGIIEHHEYRWCTYEVARKLLVPRVQAVLDWGNEKLIST